MKKTLLLGLALLGVNATNFAQTTLFEDSFDTYADFAITGVGNWTLIDVDLKTTYGFTGVTFPNSGVAKSFQVFNATTTVAPLAPTATSNWTARTGNKHMVCFAAASPAPLLNNDWLISPQITLGSSGNVLTFWAKACDSGFGAEKFKVGISSGNTTANITLLSAGTITIPSNINWVQYTYTVPASFDGQAVYFSINCVSDDQFGFAVDDFKVTTTAVASTQSFFANNFSIYPNPANNVLNLSVKNGLSVNEITMVDINGRTVKTINNAFDSEMEINVSDLTSGVYMLNVKTDEGVATSKFVKN
ncbi:T9SS type A sorting domain-containing protein [Flavobacterium gelidilacus]|jgi:hypothetical protein|uniref:T9SS-dependent choice-of-anchor J family protein n=1 Tax=Flavobacterium gelidilacus TaxID=206041 RepID=UPI000410B4BF|nr:T9SS type A sorting domain-containing protein [Flavobacterium gelidilacus]